MQGAEEHFRFRLLNEFQRGFPVVDRPFAALASDLQSTEQQVIEALVGLRTEGAITRVGATVRPNTVGASTLAAMSIPLNRLTEITTWLSGFKSVNHSYLREDEWNLWFVLAAPDATTLTQDLRDIATHTALRVLDLRLIQPFHIDLGFDLRGQGPKAQSQNQADMSALLESDRPVLHALAQGLPLVPEPYAALAHAIARPIPDVMARIEALTTAGIITRLGIIVRHRQLGWQENAMVVWDVPLAAIDAAGKAMARLPGISLCYQRRTEPDTWPYSLYCMVHARSRTDATAVITEAAALPSLTGVAHKILFSTHCYKQAGANLQRQEIAA